jgi:hypothetical protein
MVTYLIDMSRTACLCGDGAVGLSVAVAVDPDGTEHFVVIDDALLGSSEARYAAQCPTVVHEQLGPLPKRWRALVAYAPLRCGQPTKAGTSCRVVVTEAGRTCGKHRTPTTQPKESA